MQITVKHGIPDTPDCWQNGGFSCCQHLGRGYREKTLSQYFECNVFNVFLEPVANEGKPIEPCSDCMEARAETEAACTKK